MLQHLPSFLNGISKKVQANRSHVTESPNNLLICDQYLSARYIGKYSIGVEEKAQLLITAGSTEHKLRVHLGDIENNKIASAQRRLKTQESSRK